MARLIAARRTAVVPKGGAFARLSLEDLAAPVLLACLADAGISPAQVDEVILSNALGAGGPDAWKACGQAAGLNVETLDQCAAGEEGKQLVLASAKRAASRSDPTRKTAVAPPCSTRAKFTSLGRCP
ncbi:MAG: thiolase family protein, partial [Rhodobacteraceae bacterium]|nr:thiolase family protein [Paracoccaceae bacterium]